MTTALVSQLPDLGGLPLGEDQDDAELTEMMRRIGIVDGEAATPVSAFNSSI